MTREEAIKRIEDIKRNYERMVEIITDNEAEALNMAIEALNFDIDQYCKEHFCVMVDKDVWEKAERALKQEPCEDAISRQLKIGDEIYIRANVNEIRNDYIICENKGGYFGTVREEIYPRVQPKTGHWIPVEYPTGVEAFGVKEMTAVALKCSECGEEVDISDGDFKLCPYCGAEMKEGDA